jgi:signal transduction histidine kinase/HAMP domain-containing protein
MFSNATIRRRLMLIVVGVSALTVIAVAVLALGGSAATLQAQTQAALLNRNETLANTLDTKLQAVAATTQLLAANLTRQSTSPSSALWQTATNTLLQPDILISRINVYAPFRGGGNQIVIFDDPTPPSSTAPMSQLINPPIGADAWFLWAIESNALVWNGPAAGYYDTGSGQQVISVAVPYVGHNSQPIGVVWTDVSVQTIQRQIQNTIEMSDRRGYSLLIDHRGTLVGYSQLPPNSSVLRPPEAARELNEFLQTGAINGLLQSIRPETSSYVIADDPFNEERSSVVLASVLPLTGWKVVSVLPGSALDNPLALNAIAVAFVIILGLVLLAILVYLYVNRWLSKPLADLGSAAQEIGAGDLRYQIAHVERRDEIGRLAMALEDMKRNLAHSYHELSMWSQMLEKRVGERTEQLEDARILAQMHATDLHTVYDASLEVVSASELPTVLEAVTGRILWLLHASYCAVWLLMDDKEHLQLAATTSQDKSRLNTVISIHEGLAGLAVRGEEPVLIEDYPNWPHHLERRNDPNMQRAMAAPLIFYERPMGAVIVGRSANDLMFDDNDQRLLVLFANLVSPIVRNAQLYVQREEALTEVERANEVKTRFLASVTHELRTPLNLIINNMDFMRIGSFGSVSGEQELRLAQAIRSAEHLLYLINDLLDVSKIEAGEMQLFIQPSDVYPVLEDALDSAFVMLEGKGSNVALEAHIPPELPPIPMDARRVRQVLTNLLSNAVKFTMEGEIHLIVRLLDEDAIEFSVTDTGIGIPPEEMNRLFEAFERTKRAKQLGIEGTGLGLPISRYLVEAHGGEMRVETAVGHGSAFSFTLPLRHYVLETNGMERVTN